MNETKQDFSSLLDKLDLYSILRDTLRNLWAILLGAIAVAMIVNMVVRADFRKTYSKTATFNEAVNRLMAYLHREDPALYPVVLNPRTEKHTERSALQLLHQVERQYEPLAITERKRLREEAESFLRTHGGELFHS